MAYDESLMSSRGNYCFLNENKQYSTFKISTVLDVSV